MMQGDPGMDYITARRWRRHQGRISMNFRNFIERFYLVLQVLRRGVEDSWHPGPFGLQLYGKSKKKDATGVTRTRPPDKMKIYGTRNIRYTVQDHALMI